MKETIEHLNSIFVKLEALPFTDQFAPFKEGIELCNEIEAMDLMPKHNHENRFFIRHIDVPLSRIKSHRAIFHNWTTLPKNEFSKIHEEYYSGYTFRKHKAEMLQDIILISEILVRKQELIDFGK